MAADGQIIAFAPTPPDEKADLLALVAAGARV
jgi:hypothetical protein